MTCCGVKIDCFSFQKKINDLAQNNIVKYGSNIIGVIPIVGTVVGIVRIAAQILFRISQEIFNPDGNKNVMGATVARFRGIKVAQGVAELIPLAGPGIFWICRGTYLAVKQCQDCNKPVNLDMDIDF